LEGFQIPFIFPDSRNPVWRVSRSPSYSLIPGILFGGFPDPLHIPWFQESCLEGFQIPCVFSTDSRNLPTGISGKREHLFKITRIHNPNPDLKKHVIFLCCFYWQLNS
jgi:hypothetical protein